MIMAQNVSAPNADSRKEHFLFLARRDSSVLLKRTSQRDDANLTSSKTRTHSRLSPCVSAGPGFNVPLLRHVWMVSEAAGWMAGCRFT